MAETFEKFYEQFNEIWDSEANTLKCGGTYSSVCLKKALSLQIDLEEYKDHPHYQKIKDGLAKMVDLWRKALHRHNQQTLKFVEYDLETGDPKD